MPSINTNAAAITALRTLQNTNQQLDATQHRISTGLKIGEAKDNAAYWSISTTLKSDNKSLSTVKDALGLGSATVDVAYQGLNKTKDVLDEIKSKLVAATQPGIDRNVIQSEIAELQKQLVSIAGSSVFSGENWLSVDSSATDYDATKKIVSSFSRDADNSVSIGTVDVAIGNVALFDKSAVAGKDGILDGARTLRDRNGAELAFGGTAATEGNTSTAGLSAAAGTRTGGLTAAGDNNVAVGTAGAAGPGLAGTTGSGSGSPVAAQVSINAPLGIRHYAASDHLSFQYKIDGDSGFTDLRIQLSTTNGLAANGRITAAELATKLTNDATFNAKATATVDGSGNLVIQSRNAGNLAGTATKVETRSFVYAASTGTAAPVGSGTGVSTVVNATPASNVTAIDKVIESTNAPGPVNFNTGERLGIYKTTDGANWTRVTSYELNNLNFAGDGFNTITAQKLYDIAAVADGLFDGSDPSNPVLANPGTNTGKLVFTAPIGTGSPNFAVRFTLSASGQTPPSTLPDASFTELPGTPLADFNAFTTTTPGQAPEDATLRTASTTPAVTGYAASDHLSFEYSVDGTSYSELRIALTGAGIATDGAITTTELAAKLNAHADFTSAPKQLSASVPSSGPDAGKLVITAANGTNHTLRTRANVYDAAIGTGAPAGAGVGGTSLTQAEASGSGGAAASTGAVTATLNSLAGSVAAGDVITVKYTLDGNAGERQVTVGALPFDAASFRTAWGTLVGVALTNPSGQDLRFESTNAGGTSNFTLTDATVRDAAGRIKNTDVFAGLTESQAASVRTGALTWGGSLLAGDRVTLNLSADSAPLAPVTVNAGASLDDFVTNLNADATFRASLVASKTSGGELLLTSKTTGAGSAASLTSVAFATSTGAPRTGTATGLGSVVSGAEATTGVFTGPLTLDGDDALRFTVAVGAGGQAKTVEIGKALIDRTLPGSDGTIGSAADFKRVVDAALAAAGVSGVSTREGTGPDAGRLVFATDAVGTGASLAIGAADASRGGQLMSVDKLDISDGRLAALGVDDGTKRDAVLSAYITVVNEAINKVTTAAANLGAVASRIDMQRDFVNTLMDTIEKGVGGLVDADMSEESTKLQAMQVKQQLGVQALSIANQSSQNILSLFR